MAHKIIVDKKLFIFDTMDEMNDFVLCMWNKIGKESIAGKGRFTVALSGGHTPIIFYRKLGESCNPALWSKTDIFFVDERFVPHSSIYSNYKIIKENILDRIKKTVGSINPVPTEEPTPKKSAEKYEKILAGFFRLPNGKPPGFDFILLGMGEDGHTASLFPKSTSLEEKKRLVITTRKKGMPLVERISLTFPVINNGKNLVFLITGKEKAKTLKNVIEKPGCRLPAALVNPAKGVLYFLIDRQAGSLLL